MSTSVCDQYESSEHNTLLKQSNSMNKLNQAMSPLPEDPFIVHPGAISSILQLLPTVPTNEDDHVNNLISKLKA